MRLITCLQPRGTLCDHDGVKRILVGHYREWVTYSKFDTERLRRQEIVHWVIMQEARMLGRAIINFFTPSLFSTKANQI